VRRRRKGWAPAGPQRPVYSGAGHIVSPRAQLVGFLKNELVNFVTGKDEVHFVCISV